MISIFNIFPITYTIVSVWNDYIIYWLIYVKICKFPILFIPIKQYLTHGVVRYNIPKNFRHTVCRTENDGMRLFTPLSYRMFQYTINSVCKKIHIVAVPFFRYTVIRYGISKNFNY